MGQREQKRAVVLNQGLAGLATVAEGAAALGLSVRQRKRRQAADQQAGPSRLVAGNRGRSTAWAAPPVVAERIVALAPGRSRASPGSL